RCGVNLATYSWEGATCSPALDRSPAFRIGERIMLARRLVVSLGVRSWIAAVIFFFASTLFASDTVLIHGHIYTGNPKAPWAQALAITGSHIDAVGTDQEILSRWADKAATKSAGKAEVIDLRGRTVIPGISDSHTH